MEREMLLLGLLRNGEMHGYQLNDYIERTLSFCAGVKKAMDEIGATTEVLGTGNDHAQALNLMTQYLLGHPEIQKLTAT